LDFTSTGLQLIFAALFSSKWWVKLINKCTMQVMKYFIDIYNGILKPTGVIR